MCALVDVANGLVSTTTQRDFTFVVGRLFANHSGNRSLRCAYRCTRSNRHATDIYVDDFLIARTSLRWIEDSVSFSEEFGINDLGDHELLSGASADCNHEL